MRVTRPQNHEAQPYPVGPLLWWKRSNTVTRWPALLSCAAALKPAGPEPMTATLLAGAFLGRLGHDPAVFPAVINDRALDVLDRDGGLVHAEHARTFARRRAHAAGELREIICLVQPLQRFLPQSAIDEIVPLGNQVVNRAAAGHAADQLAGVAERNAAIHAPRALLAQVGFQHVADEIPSSRRCEIAPNDPLAVRVEIPEILLVFPWCCYLPENGSLNDRRASFPRTRP